MLTIFWWKGFGSGIPDKEKEEICQQKNDTETLYETKPKVEQHLKSIKMKSKRQKMRIFKKKFVNMFQTENESTKKLLLMSICTLKVRRWFDEQSTTKIIILKS